MSKGLLQRPIEIRGKSVDLNGGGSAPALLGVVEADESWQSLSHLFFFLWSSLVSLISLFAALRWDYYSSSADRVSGSRTGRCFA